MANISLREYIRKIENLIDNGQIDQAIGHCKHILQIYPKHIDSYRLLGKALLEKQKYGDASDIFQRVLSSVPDDFISHIGMSIIREDENNLDAAIWHMERAFEVQPSNKAVQDELRRLYTNRDGVAPPKIRLTRGALVRMYTRGELYNQAIAEIWAALSEDPNRVDLEVILARIYFLLGQKVEATETCSKLIGKLPYCYEANKILTEILPGTTREEDEKVFRQRVVDLDPYFQFVNEKTFTTADVTDTNIMVDFLEWDPSIIIDEEPDWAQSIGFALGHENAANEEFSSWLDNAISPPNEPLEEKSEDLSEQQATEEIQDDVVNLNEIKDEINEISFPTENKKEDNQEIPDWIKEAGWEVSTEEDENLDKGFTIPSILLSENEIPNSEVDNLIEDSVLDDKEEDEAIQPAEIPGWLKEIAPSENSMNISEEEDEFEVKNLEELFDNLESDKSEFIKSESGLSWENEFIEGKEKSLEDTLQGFDFSSISLNNFESETNFESAPESEIEEKFEDKLDWIKDLSIDDSSNENEEETKITTNVNFSEIKEEKEEEINKQSLDQIITELEEFELEESNLTPNPDEEWLNSLILNENKEDNEKEFSLENENADIPDWIKSVIEEEVAQPSFSSMEELDSLPDWLSSSVESVKGNLDDIKISFDEIKDQSIPVDNTINFEEIGENNEEIFIEEPLPDLVDDELSSTPEELKNTDSDINIKPSMLEIENFVPDLENPNLETEKPEEIIEEDQFTREEKEDELESALAWMEGLALKQGAEEETLLSKPEERSEIPPEWISEESKLSQDIGEELDTTPSWLKELEIETGGIQLEDTAQTLEEISSTEFLNSSDDKTVEIASDMDQDVDKVHDFKVLFEELDTKMVETQPSTFEQSAGDDIDDFAGIMPEITKEEPLPDHEPFNLEIEENDEEFIFPEPIEEFEAQIEIAELEHDEIESQELIPELPIEDDVSIEESGEESIAYLEEVSITEEISNIMDQKFGVIEETSRSEDQIIEPYEEILESISDEQKSFSPLEDEIEDTQPIKVKDDKLSELETADKFLQSGNPEESIKIFDQLIHESFELDSIIENIQNALDHHYPIDINLWQSLGDAYLKNNQLQNALDAYSKAEDLLL